MIKNWYLKIVGAVIFIMLGIYRIIKVQTYGEKTNETTILIFAVAFLIIIVPWDRLSSFKAGGLEVDISELKETQKQQKKISEDLASIVNRVEQSLIPIISGKNPHQSHRLEKEKKLIIGSKEFPEQIILGNLLVNYIKEKLPDISCEGIIPNGGTLKNWADLTSGWIDGYIEYTGTGGMLLNMKKKLYGLSASKAIEELNDESDKQHHNIKWLKPLGLENTYVVAMRAEDSEKLKIKTLMDLKKRSVRKLTFCCHMEFFNRPDCLSRLVRLYNVHFGHTKIINPSDRYRLIEDGSCQVIAAFRTDPELQDLLKSEFLVDLKDKHDFFPKYEAVPVFNNEALKLPGLKDALEAMKNVLSNEGMSDMISKFQDRGTVNDEEVCKKLTNSIIKSIVYPP